VRYEVTVRPDFKFGPGFPSFDEISEPIGILSAGNTFVWHPSRPATDGGAMCGPVVSVVAEGKDQERAALSVNRFLAALSYAVDYAIGIGWSVASGFKAHLDPPIACPPPVHAGMILRPVTEVRVTHDDRLYDVLGLYREGISAESPYHHFQSLHNALVAAFDGNEDAAEKFATENQGNLFDAPTDVEELGAYFRDVLRNAIAHTVRKSGKPTLDPNSPSDRNKAADATRPMREIVRLRVEERWPGGVRAV
jgi:hypothetical protein